MKKYNISLERKIEGSVDISAKSEKDAKKKVLEGLREGLIDVDDNNQFYGNWKLQSQIDKTSELCAKFNQSLGAAKYACSLRGYKLKLLENFKDGCYDSLWNGGHYLSIENKDIEIVIGAYGDVRACLNLNGQEIETVDKSNGGRFLDDLGDYIENDDELYELINKGSLTFENNNWWEALVIEKKDGTAIDGDNGVLDQSSMTEVLDAIEEILDWAEECLKISKEDKENNQKKTN